MKTYTHCVYCGKRKKIPDHVKRKPGSKAQKTRGSTYVDPLVYQQDPYCSRVCCEADLAAKAKEDAA